MSEKAPSEILEEEEYVNGQAIKKKYWMIILIVF